MRMRNQEHRVVAIATAHGSTGMRCSIADLCALDRKVTHHTENFNANTHKYQKTSHSSEKEVCCLIQVALTDV